MERVVQERKVLQKKDSVAYDNRLYAREMTHNEFKIWWKDQQEIDPNQTQLFEEDEKRNKDGFDSMSDILKKYKLDGVKAVD